MGNSLGCHLTFLREYTIVANNSWHFPPAGILLNIPSWCTTCWHGQSAIRKTCLTWLLILIGYLYWVVHGYVYLRTDIKKTCLKGIGLHAQHVNHFRSNSQHNFGDLFDCFMAPTFLILEAICEIRIFHRLLQKPHNTSMYPKKSLTLESKFRIMANIKN